MIDSKSAAAPQPTVREYAMWEELTEMLNRISRTLSSRGSRRRTEEARARFWSEVNKGREEAENPVAPEDERKAPFASFV